MQFDTLFRGVAGENLVCELFAMPGRESATVNFSLRVLAEHGGKSGPHADGWGITFYERT